MSAITNINFQSNKQGKKWLPDLDQLEQLAMFQSTDEEICAAFGINVSTLWRVKKRAKAGEQYAIDIIETIDRGKAKGRFRIRRQQFELAVNQSNVQMLIHLGKTVLNQKEIKGINLNPTAPKSHAEITDIAKAIVDLENN